ncbi:glycosyltransferase family 71 protein [Parathielavia appendiculata]|uniref:Glycosyltransferase family 71 protein n=1 Tax=Parathielavia appendiculata TaxID=2587402 RepID=A0AAN6TPT4_9PEZI|nr:glycosyltransferase family 71 protein [Parathielavia appendiculata]
MAVGRRPRLLVAMAIVAIVALLTFHQRDAIADIRYKYVSSGGTATHSQKTGQPDPEAHKLPWADSFRDHFRAVTRLKGLTMAEAKAGCHWPEDQYVNFQYSPDTEWVVTQRSDTEIVSRRKLWQEYVERQMIPWDKVKNKFAGKGIVVVAGTSDTVMRLKVVLRRLAKLQSKLPVEVHYWDDETDENTLKELAGMHHAISFNDLSDPATNIIHIRKDRLVNYQLKPAALINSKFAEPLLLDSDNVPVLDPAVLYESRVYREYHTVFWPDIARSRPQNPAWALTNTACRTDEYEQESGQLMGGQAAGDYWNEFLLGDKDMFRFAWHALKTDFGRPRKWLTSVGTLNEGFYCGHTFAQHHPDDGRVAFMHGGLAKFVALEVIRWNKEERGGYFRHYKRAPSDEDPSVSVHVDIIFDGADYKPNHTENFKVTMCTEMKDVEARDFDEILPGWEKEYQAVGGYWQLEQETREKAEAGKAKGGGP